MTQYTDYSEIQTQLDASWNAVVIAKPTFKDGKVRMEINLNTIYIKMETARAEYVTSGVNASDQITTKWQMRLITESKADADKYLDEVRRILSAYDLTNGYWHVDSWNLHKVGKIFYYECDCSEQLWDLS